MGGGVVVGEPFCGGPNGYGGPIWGWHPFGFNGGGTMGRRNRMWRVCWWWGDPIVEGIQWLWGTHFGDAPIWIQ